MTKVKCERCHNEHLDNHTLRLGAAATGIGFECLMEEEFDTPMVQNLLTSTNWYGRQLEKANYYLLMDGFLTDIENSGDLTAELIAELDAEFSGPNVYHAPASVKLAVLNRDFLTYTLHAPEAVKPFGEYMDENDLTDILVADWSVQKVSSYTVFTKTGVVAINEIITDSTYSLQSTVESGLKWKCERGSRGNNRVYAISLDSITRRHHVPENINRLVRLYKSKGYERLPILRWSGESPPTNAIR